MCARSGGEAPTRTGTCTGEQVRLKHHGRTTRTPSNRTTYGTLSKNTMDKPRCTKERARLVRLLGPRSAAAQMRTRAACARGLEESPTHANTHTTFHGMNNPCASVTDQSLRFAAGRMCGAQPGSVQLFWEKNVGVGVWVDRHLRICVCERTTVQYGLYAKPTRPERQNLMLACCFPLGETLTRSSRVRSVSDFSLFFTTGTCLLCAWQLVSHSRKLLQSKTVSSSPTSAMWKALTMEASPHTSLRRLTLTCGTQRPTINDLGKWVPVSFTDVAPRCNMVSPGCWCIIGAV